MTERFLKFPLFYLANELIQQKNGVGKFKKIHVILNFPALDFLVHKIKERKFQKNFYRSLPYFYTYPDSSQIAKRPSYHHISVKCCVIFHAVFAIFLSWKCDEKLMQNVPKYFHQTNLDKLILMIASVLLSTILVYINLLLM